MAASQSAQRAAASRHATYPFDTLIDVLGSLLRVPRLQKIEVIEWLQANHAYFERRQLRAYYGMMLRLLTRSVPIKPMVDLLVLITDVHVVTQSRVNFVCNLFIVKMNSPSLGRLLQAMAAACGPSIYVPPLGQKHVQHARVPLGVALSLAGEAGAPPPETRRRAASVANTRLYEHLMFASRGSDTDFAGALAQLVPLVQQAGRVPLGVELCVYNYLAAAWVTEHGAERTQALQVFAAALLRYWPRLSAATLQARVLDALAHAKRSAAEVLIPHLWHLGPAVSSLMDALVARARPATLDWHSERVCARYVHVYQFYAGLARLPPPAVVADLIVRLKGYLALCAKWSTSVPAISATLEGEFSLVTTDAAAAYVDTLFGSTTETDLLFSLANSPWLGAYPQRTYSRLKVETDAASRVLISAQRPASSVIKIDDVSLHDLGLTLQRFCEQLVSDLVQENLDVRQYLLDLDALAP